MLHTACPNADLIIRVYNLLTWKHFYDELPVIVVEYYTTHAIIKLASKLENII